MFGPMQALRLEHGLAREDSHLLALHSPQSVPSASTEPFRRHASSRSPDLLRVMFHAQYRRSLKRSLAFRPFATIARLSALQLTIDR